MLLLNFDLVDRYGHYMYRVHEHSTAKRYMWEVKQAVAFLSDSFKGSAPPVAAIGTEHLLAYLTHTAERSDTPARAAWNNRLRPLCSFWNYLREAGLTDANPAERIKPAKIRSDQRLPLTFSEFLDLIEAIANSSPHYRTRNLAMVMTLFFCGLRVSELTRLKLSHIDWANSVFVNLRVKGGKHIDVHFPKSVAEALSAWVVEREQFHPADDQQACFLSDRSSQISVRQLQSILSHYGKLAEIHRPVSPHVVRHTSATELARGGLNLFALKDFLAHESIVTTQRYVHLGDDIKQAVDGLDERLVTAIATRRRVGDQQAGLTLSPTTNLT